MFKNLDKNSILMMYYFSSSSGITEIMNPHADKTLENKSQSVSAAESPLSSDDRSTFQFVDNRPEVFQQKKLHDIANSSEQVMQLKSVQEITNHHFQKNQSVQLQAMPYGNSDEPIQKKENQTGLPDKLKSGMEHLSGMSLDDIRVHRNSDKPAQLQAHAYAQGNDIHLGAGQEKHLPHEAWHVVQQKQGRVKPTIQMKGEVNINDDSGLEKEADVMGAKALSMQYEVPNPPNTNDVTSSSSMANEVQQKKLIPKLSETATSANVVQRTVWRLVGGEWEEIAPGNGESAPPREMNSFAEGQIVDTSPSKKSPHDPLAYTEKHKDLDKSKNKEKGKNKSKGKAKGRGKAKSKGKAAIKNESYIEKIGGGVGGHTALIVGVYMDDELADEDTLIEQNEQQKSISDVYGSFGVNSYLNREHGGNKLNVGEESVYTDIGPTNNGWRKTCVLILNAHGNVDWFFGNSPGKEVEAIGGVSTWIRALQEERDILFKTIVLESCHSGEELVFGPNTEHHRFQQCPARLLSFALSGVKVVGFNGNTITKHRKVKVADSDGNDLHQNYASNAVVFLDGKVYKGTTNNGEQGVHHTFENIDEDAHEYYRDLFDAYRKSYDVESTNTYLSQSFTDASNKVVEPDKFDFENPGQQTTKFYLDQLYPFVVKNFEQKMSEFQFTDQQRELCWKFVENYLFQIENKLNENPDIKMYYFDKAKKVLTGLFYKKKKSWLKVLGKQDNESTDNEGAPQSRNLNPIDEETYERTIHQIRESGPDRLDQEGFEVYVGYLLSVEQMEYAQTNNLNLLSTVPDGDCAIAAVLGSLEMDTSPRTMSLTRVTMANNDEFTDAEANEIIQPGDWQYSDRWLPILAENLSVEITIIQENGEPLRISAQEPENAITIFHVNGIMGHFYGTSQ